MSVDKDLVSVQQARDLVEAAHRAHAEVERVLPVNGRTGLSPDESALQGGGARGQLGQGDQGRSLGAGNREPNKERAR